MKKFFSMLIALLLLASFTFTTEAMGDFNAEQRKLELQKETEEFYDWVQESYLKSREKVLNTVDADLLGPTPGAPRKYVTSFRIFRESYLRPNPAPQTIFYEDEFYSGTLSIIEVGVKHVVGLETTYFVTYGGTVTLKNYISNETNSENLDKRMKEYYDEQAKKPVLSISYWEFY